MPDILFTYGLDDTNMVEIQRIGTQSFETLYSVPGTVTLAPHLNLKGFNKAVFTFGGVETYTLRVKLPDVVFNCICDPDTNKRTLEQVTEFLNNAKVPAINHPDKIFASSRDNVYQLIKDIPGVFAPQVRRITPNGVAEILNHIKTFNLDLPVIIRPAGTHGGRGAYVLRSYDDINELERYPFDGSDYYLIQYADFARDDGLYRKYRFLVIDGECYIRHLFVDDQWDVNLASRTGFMAEHPDAREEERQFLEAFNSKQQYTEVRDILHEIHRRLGLDFFGVDCSLLSDGRLQTFEVNACMNVLVADSSDKPAHLQENLRSIETAFEQMIKRRVTG